MEGKITKIFNAADQIQAEMIHDHLKQNGIETMSKQPGTGEYMSIAMGYSVYGTDIYVREDQKAKAEALINELLYDNDYNTFEDEDCCKMHFRIFYSCDHYHDRKSNLPIKQ